MKNQMRKGLAGFLSIVLCAGLVMTGCNTTDTKTSSSQQASTGSSTTSTETSTETSTGQDEAATFGSVSVMTYDRGVISNAEGDMTNNRWTQWINENAPFDQVSFVAVPKAEAPQIMSNLFSAGDAPDVIATYEDIKAFVTNGMALEITDEMIDKMPNYKRMLDEYPAIDKLTQIDGKRYAIGKISNVLPNHTIVVRKDWLDKLGLAMPETPEDIIAISKAFTENDPDGNGANDTWGISMTTDTQRVLSFIWGYPNPEKYAMIDGELTYTWDAAEKWVEFSKQLVDNGYVNPDFLTMKGDDDRADFLNGKIGIYASGRFSQVNTTIFSDFKAKNPEGTLETFALPATENGSYISYINGGPSIVGFINAEAKNIDGALAYVDWLCDPKVTEYLMFGEDGVYYTKDAEGTHVVVDAGKNEIEFNYGSDYSIIKNELLTGSDVPIDIHADDYYNQYLKSGDPVLQEFGDLYYRMCLVANDTQAQEPRKWQQALPVLPTELALIRTTANKQIDDMLKASLADKSQTAQVAIELAKKAWYDAGGQKVDDYYAQYYKDMGAEALLAEDFDALKDQPQMTAGAQEHSKLAKEGQLTLR